MNRAFREVIDTELRPGTLVIACGLPASYKTETTEVIASMKGYTVLRTDMLRLEVLKNEDIFDEEVASNMEKRTLVYDEMFRMAEELAGKGHSLVLDATFITQSLRRRAAEVASRHGLTLVIQHTRCPKKISLRRIAQRSKENYESNALTEQAYNNNVKRFERIDLKDLKRIYTDLRILYLSVDTSSDAEQEWCVIGMTKQE
jgi:predicted kinase